MIKYMSVAIWSRLLCFYSFFFVMVSHDILIFKIFICPFFLASCKYDDILLHLIRILLDYIPMNIRISHRIE